VTKTKDRCECPHEAVLNSLVSGWYDEETELPFASHAPGACRCTNELQLFLRGDEVLTLCSCCHVPGDVRCAS
jgi:hypothetical protein